MNLKIIYFTRPTWYSKIAYHYLRTHFKNTQLISEKIRRKDKIKKCDLIVAFGYQKIIPKYVLSKAKYAINFHPSTLNNPGAGSYSYPLYNNENYHGVVCHEIKDKPDTGRIIKELKFKIQKKDNFLSLRDRTLVLSLKLFYEIFDMIIKKNKVDFKFAKKKWKRKPRLYKEYLNEILTVKNRKDMKIKTKTIHPYLPGPFSKNKKLKKLSLLEKNKYRYKY